MKPKAEQSLLWLGTFSALTFVVALIFTGLVPSQDPNWSYATATDQIHYHTIYQPVGPNGAWVPVSQVDKTKPFDGYTPLQHEGRLVYMREGCLYCHSQQIRPLDPEMERYGIGTSAAPAADEREYLYDEPHFLGTKRNGPDLSRVGGKYSDDWQYSHLYNPPQMVPGSIMPAFQWLFTNPNPADPSARPTPNHDAIALVAYLQTLGASRQIFDSTLNGGKGGWRPWLKPQDALFNQQAAQQAVYRAATPVITQGGEKAGSRQ